MSGCFFTEDAAASGWAHTVYDGGPSRRRRKTSVRANERMSWRILKGLWKETTETLRRTVSVNWQPPSLMWKALDRRRSHAHTAFNCIPKCQGDALEISLSCAGQEVAPGQTKESKDALFLMLWCSRQLSAVITVFACAEHCGSFGLFSCLAMFPPPQSPDQTIPVLVLSGDACVVLWRSRTHSGFELRNAGWCFVYKLASALITDLDCSRIDFYHLLCTKSKCVGCKNVLVTSGMIVVGRCLHWALHLLTCCHDSCVFFFFVCCTSWWSELHNKPL